MELYDEIQYIYQLPLRNLIKFDYGFRCSCPICNEGKSPGKRRCNIITNKDHNLNYITVTCFNCGLTTNLKEFIRQVSPSVFADYEAKEKASFLKDLQEGKLKKKRQDLKREVNTNTSLTYQFKLNEKYFVPAKEVEKAVKFCENRKIVDNIDEFYYSMNPKSESSGMLIFPFYMEDRKTMYGFQGRHTEEKRFHTHSKNESLKVYNLFGVTKDKPVIAVESLIDSLSVDNSIAMLGSDLSSRVQAILKNHEVIYAFDFDATGLQKSIKYGQAGNKVFVWPNVGKIKDFNDLAKLGWTKTEITDFIKKYTYEGIELNARLSFKSMEKRK